MGSTKTGKSGKSGKSLSKKNKLVTQMEEETDVSFSPPVSPSESGTGSLLGGRNMDKGGMSNPSPSLHIRRNMSSREVDRD